MRGKKGKRTAMAKNQKNIVESKKRKIPSPDSDDNSSYNENSESDNENVPLTSKQKNIRKLKTATRKLQENEIVIPTPIPQDSEIDLENFQPEVIDPNLSFSSLGGLDKTIDQLRLSVMIRMEHKKFFLTTFDVTPVKGILFYGPSGTGKTLLATALASELSKLNKGKVTFFYRKGADLLSKYVGESENSIKFLFDQAKAKKPSMIFFDEIDAICCTRSDESSNQHYNTLVCSILSQMDCLVSGDVLVIGATNRLDSLDPAFRRHGRFECEIGFQPPNQNGRKDILNVHLNKWVKEQQPNEITLNDIACRTTGFTGADLKDLCQSALNCALIRNFPDKKFNGKELKKVSVEREDWLQALKFKIPSNSNVFGNYNFTGICIPSSLEPLINGIKNNILEWINSFLNKIVNGFNFSIAWSNNEEYLKQISNLIIPYALTSLIIQDKQIIIMSEENLVTNTLLKILKNVSKSSMVTILYFPRIDLLNNFIKNTVIKILQEQKILKCGQSHFLVIGTCLKDLNNLDEKFIKLIREPMKILKVSNIQYEHIQNFFIPTINNLKSSNPNPTNNTLEDFDKLFEKFLKKTEGLDLDIINDLNIGLQECKNMVESQKLIQEFINEHEE